jgi:hypothetical protein
MLIQQTSAIIIWHYRKLLPKKLLKDKINFMPTSNKKPANSIGIKYGLKHIKIELNNREQKTISRHT